MAELLTTYHEDGTPAGPVDRDAVHARGLWHRAVHVWLYDGAGRVYVQRRSRRKDVSPGLWDVACGEHVQPGESWLDGARRGLVEELGVTGVALEAVGAPRPHVLARTAIGIVDREMQQLFTATYTGTPRPDPAEVAELRLLTPAALRAAIAADPAVFASGLREDVARFGDRLMPTAART